MYELTNGSGVESQPVAKDADMAILPKFEPAELVDLSKSVGGFLAEVCVICEVPPYVEGETLVKAERRLVDVVEGCAIHTWNLLSRMAKFYFNMRIAEIDASGCTYKKSAVFAAFASHDSGKKNALKDYATNQVAIAKTVMAEAQDTLNVINDADLKS